MSEETYQERQEREEREYAAKVAKAWAKYKDRKDGKRQNGDGNQYTITFPDGVTDTEDHITVRETVFRFYKGEKTPKYLQKMSTKRQKFLVVNGPLANHKIVDEDEAYVLYNVSSRWYKAPKCVLIHRSSFEKLDK